MRGPMRRKILLLGATGLVGRAAAGSLGENDQIIPAAGHGAPENGYRLPVEDPDRLLEVLTGEDPDVVISSVRGDYPAQMAFHRTLAEWMAGKEKRLLYMSTANVFDGSLSQPWTEDAPPAPASDYGVFKRECEEMLGQLLGEQLAVFRLAAVWSPGCPRVRQLRRSSESGEPHPTYPGYTINVTLADQIGDYAKYVLSRGLHGIFHVGTTDTVNYAAFEEMVCRALHIPLPVFAPEPEEEAFLAVLPARGEIPADLQMTVSDVLSALKNSAQARTAKG